MVDQDGEDPIVVIVAIDDDGDWASVVAFANDDFATILQLPLSGQYTIEVDGDSAGGCNTAPWLAGGWLLGLLIRPATEYFQADSRLDAATIEARIEARNEARANKDYAGADAIRDELLEAGIELEDTREGTRWKVIGKPDD